MATDSDDDEMKEATSRQLGKQCRIFFKFSIPVLIQSQNITIELGDHIEDYILDPETFEFISNILRISTIKSIIILDQALHFD